MCRRLTLTTSVALVALMTGGVYNANATPDKLIKLQTPIVYGSHQGSVVTFEYGDTGQVEEKQAATAPDVPEVEQAEEEEATTLLPRRKKEEEQADDEGGANKPLRHHEHVDGPARIIDDTVLVEKTNAVIVVGDPGSVKPKASAEEGSVDIGEGLVVPGRAKRVLRSFVGNSISLKSLDQLSVDLVQAYRASGLPVVNVVIPEQDITNGNLQVMVITATLAEVNVQGVKDDSKQYYLDNFTSETGEVIEAGTVLADLSYMSRNPFRSVNAVYTPGDEFGTTNIILRPIERRPYTFYVGTDNTGNHKLGEGLVSLGAVYGDLWHRGHIIGYQLTAAPENIKGTHTHVLTYTAPFKKRQELQLIAAYTKSEGDLNQDIKQDGNSFHLSAYYFNQLKGYRNWAHNILAGVEYKRTENSTIFDGDDVSDQAGAIFQLAGKYSGEMMNTLGRLRGFVGVTWGPGGIGGDNNNTTWDSIRPGSSASYVYGSAGLEQEIDMPHDWRLLVSSEGQWSSNALPNSETFNLGGVGSVRGWHQSVGRIDTGGWVNANLFTPAIRAASRNSQSFDDALRFYGFVDYGYGHRKAFDETQGDTVEMASTGVGLNYRAAENFFFDVSYGHQLKEEGIYDDGDDGRVHFKARLQY